MSAIIATSDTRIAAVYARKSTDDSDRSDEARSTTRQIERAREYAARKGWAVDDRYIYVDEAVSGAEWKRRHGFNALLAALAPRPPFNVVIVSELSRIGRDAVRTPAAVLELEEAGVGLVSYLNDAPITLGDEAGEMRTTLDSLLSSWERRRARQRTHDALRRRAEAGAVTGGQPYATRNVCDRCETPTVPRRTCECKATVRRVLHAEEAKVVLHMATLYVQGKGYKAIAMALNADGVRSPRGTGSWDGSCVRAILLNPLYRGVLRWNQTQKVDRGGSTHQQRHRPGGEWVERPAAHLRIFDDALWAQIEAHRQREAEAYTRRAGGRFHWRTSRRDGESPYLLTSHLTCKQCGAAIGGRTQLHGSPGRRVRHTFYGCNYHGRRGPSVCSNETVLRTEIIDTAVLDAIRKAIDPSMVAEAVDRALAALTSRHAAWDAQQATLERELKDVDARVNRAVQGIVTVGASDALVAQLKIEEQRQRDLRARLAQVQTARGVAALDTAEIKRDVLGLVGDVTGVLRDHLTPQTRMMLRKVLAGQIVAEPITVGGRRGYRLRGHVTFASFLRGDVLEALKTGAQPDGGGPNGIRTRVSALRGPCPGPLDDGAGQLTVSGWGRRARTPITGARTRRPTIRRSPRITATTHD